LDGGDPDEGPAAPSNGNPLRSKSVLARFLFGAWTMNRVFVLDVNVRGEILQIRFEPLLPTAPHSRKAAGQTG
jgi:hypothetical protein